MKQRRYFHLLQFVLNFLAEQMKLVAPGFSRRVAEIYCGGSFFDGLKTDSQPQEFDMNIIFHFNPDYFHLCALGFFEGKENFCFLRAGGPKGCPNSMQEYVDFISPLDLFNELLSSVDKAISTKKHLIEDPDKELRFRITRSVGAPVTVKVKSERKMLKKQGCVKKVIMLIQVLARHSDGFHGQDVVNDSDLTF